MLVYRIEDERGRGAFGDTGFYHHHDVVASMDGITPSSIHPTPRCPKERGTPLHEMYGEGFLRDYPNHRFGCRSLHQLRMWFRSPAGCQAMADNGALLATYWVPDQYVVRGRYQVAFNINHAIQIEKVPAHELHSRAPEQGPRPYPRAGQLVPG